MEGVRILMTLQNFYTIKSHERKTVMSTCLLVTIKDEVSKHALNRLIV